MRTAPVNRRSFISVTLCCLFVGFGISAAHLGFAANEKAASEKPVPRTNYTIADLGLELLWVNPGTFTMGSPLTEPNRNQAESPAHEVTLTKGFWLGKTEVTQSQYEKLIGENPSTFKTAGKNAPVERVSWLDAMAYCRALTERERAAGRLPEGLVYSLPTEAQWEYACRAGSTTAYAGEPEATAWHAENSDGTTHEVATKRPNAWGFYDLAGNVLEWCYDWYDDYPNSAVSDPSGPKRGYYRVARGGSWRMEAHVGRSAARSGGSAGRLDYTLGFRLALVPAR